MLAANSLRQLQVKVFTLARQNPKTTLALVGGATACDYLLIKSYLQSNSDSKQ
ncbi:hypothetical protein PPL_01312 [Heterostelium album PN500]|uniref:Uncharacterized protein n=1 Tax=Heterostelium pallidum (strain ATCC 26659 / Pp 5 / PN500) TaxID=670386 RepID=D3AYP8_HETP5|nr:hypothetical protein PPL_01312 [Heterostelium album PN500]EFA86075.1 hypothetical protein PPL_01312 [Heterostelium album PN500]|eukprot:XP_020438181.1 hypothetical protein PPL_01312 [Heterostelium album PN500]